MCVKSEVAYQLFFASILTSFLYLQGCSPTDSEDPVFKDPEYVFAFALTDLDETAAKGLTPPDSQCFYPVTLEALLQSDHVKYSWLPHTKIPERKKDVAPAGAYVYEMKDGSYRFKTIKKVPVSAENAVLKFGDAVTWEKAKTFEEIVGGTIEGDEATELEKAIGCFQADISLTEEPFSSYKQFVWAAGPFGKGKCGAFVYEKKDGGIVYHEC